MKSDPKSLQRLRLSDGTLRIAAGRRTSEDKQRFALRGQIARLNCPQVFGLSSQKQVVLFGDLRRQTKSGVSEITEVALLPSVKKLHRPSGAGVQGSVIVLTQQVPKVSNFGLL
jgi:hypothetical protein